MAVLALMMVVFSLVVSTAVSQVVEKVNSVSPTFTFKKEFGSITTNIAFIDEKPEYSCLQIAGAQVKIEFREEVHGNYSYGTIVNHTMLNEAFKDRYEIKYSNGSLDLVDQHPEANAYPVYFSCTHLYSTSSLMIFIIPREEFVNITGSKSQFSFQTFCQVDVNFTASCSSNTSTVRTVVNDTHCLLSLAIEFKVGEPCYVNATVGLVNVTNVETRLISYVILGKTNEGEITTEQMSIVTENVKKGTIEPKNSAIKGKVSMWVIAVVLVALVVCRLVM